MKEWDIISRLGEKIRVDKDFERLCQNMMDAPSFGWRISVPLDNEFYARFGISAETAAALLRGQMARDNNQKHIPTY